MERPRRQCVVASEAVPSEGRQHRTPCSDCPWARTALNGWLGSLTAEEWLRAAHSEALIDCHTISGAQCAGAATYRANVLKLPLAPNLRLEKDRERVFATPAEFLEHHRKPPSIAPARRSRRRA